MSAELSLADKNDLQYHEQRIEQGLKTFFEVGESLAEIKARKLYRSSHDTFDQYVKDRWKFTSKRAYQLIDSHEVRKSTMVDKKPVVTNERQARELKKVPKEKRQEVVELAVKETDGNLTAKAIQKAAKTVEGETVEEETMLDAEQEVHRAVQKARSHFFKLCVDIPAAHREKFYKASAPAGINGNNFSASNELWRAVHESLAYYCKIYADVPAVHRANWRKAVFETFERRFLVKGASR